MPSPRAEVAEGEGRERHLLQQRRKSAAEEEKCSSRRERHPRSSRERLCRLGPSAWLSPGELGWVNKAGREGEKCGRVLPKKGKTEGKNIAGLQVGKRLRERREQEEIGHGCKPQ